jgi:acyl-coenzyme A thioesterase PaaI-like protein
MSILTPDEVQHELRTHLPACDQHDEIVESVGDGAVRMRLPFRDAFMGRDVWHDTGGAVFSGPMVMGLADTAMYACLRAAYGRDALGIIQTMTINFLRPAQPADMIADVRIVRRGTRSNYLEVHLYSDGSAEPIAHVTATAVVRARVGGGAQR